jgi:ubiquinone/menaquinone biosynthesis C-methylase UbiE
LTGRRSEAVGPAETDRVREIWAKFAPRYDRQIAFFERILFGGARAWACSRVRGDVLEVGIGTGRNLEHYPRGVRLTGVDLSPEMLAIARRRSHSLEREVDLLVADAESLEFPDGSFDTVVSTLTMCSIPDHRAALAEARRVLRPGGRLVMVEHVRSPAAGVRLGQRVLNPLAVRFAADHLLREPLRDVRRLGLEVLELERLKWGIVERLIARKPGRKG